MTSVVRLAGWVVCLFGAAACAAAEVVADEGNALDRSRAALRDGTGWIARKVDGWFGDRPFEEGGKVSGSLRVKSLWRQDDGFNNGVRFRVRLELPNLKERTYLFLGQDNERELVTDRPEPFTREQQLLAERRGTDQTLFAGLGYALRDRVELRLGVRGGLKVYAQARYRAGWALSQRDRLDFTETVYWTVKDSFGSTTSLNYEHAYSPSLALRWRNAGTVSRRTDGLAWSSGLGLFKALSDQRLLSLEALANGESKAHVGVREYGLRMVWRQAIYRDWLLGELIVGHFWPRKEADMGRKRSWAIGVGVEMHF